MGKKRNRLAIGVALAAGVGYVAGILTAPKSGKQTRKDIKTAAIKSRNEIEAKLKTLHSELGSQIKHVEKAITSAKGHAEAEMKEAVKKAMFAKEKAREVLSALHEGEAEDVDLDNAMKEIKTALTDLKKFVSKSLDSK